MESYIKNWVNGRKLLLHFFDQYTPDQLNKIPDGFNNNLIWNLGHIIAVQQLVVYKPSNLEMKISESLADLYRPRTQPTRVVTEEEIAELRELMSSLIEPTVSDLRNGAFTTYQEWTTSTGFNLATVKDALAFNTYHEGMHFGYMMSIRKFL